MMVGFVLRVLSSTGGIPHRITQPYRVGGCAQRLNVLGLLFEEQEVEDIIPVRLRASCQRMLSKDCCLEHESGGCPRYRTGTRGNIRISWDAKEKRM